MAGVRLLDVSVELAGGRPLADELWLRTLGDGHRDEGRHRHRYQGHQGQDRGDIDHHRDDADDREQGGEQLAHRLLQGLGDVVDVVGDPAEQLAGRGGVEVGQRHTAKLRLDVSPHLVDGPLHNDRHDPALDPGQDRGCDIQHQDSQQDMTNDGEVDAAPRYHIHGRDHVRDLAVPGGSQLGDGLDLCHPCRQMSTDQPGEDQVGGRTQHLGADDRQGHAHHRQRASSSNQPAVAAQPGHQPAQRNLEVQGFYRRPCPHVTQRTPPPRSGSGCGRRACGLRVSAHAASCSLSWDSTICR